jgi:putative transposase
MIAIGTPLVRETMAMRLKALEDENAKLKRLYADAMLDNAALKDLLGRKW